MLCPRKEEVSKDSHRCISKFTEELVDSLDALNGTKKMGNILWPYACEQNLPDKQLRNKVKKRTVS